MKIEHAFHRRIAHALKSAGHGKETPGLTVWATDPPAPGARAGRLAWFLIVSLSGVSLVYRTTGPAGRPTYIGRTLAI